MNYSLPMSKVLFPRNVKKGLFNMNMNIGPLSVSLVQVFILMIGLGAGLGTFQLVPKSVGKTAGIVIAIPIVLLFLVIAFFKVSEMGLLEFLTKVARNNFFDSNKKYQTQYMRVTDPHAILLSRVHGGEKKEKIETKELILDEKELAKIKEGGLL